MDTTCTLELSKKELHLLAQCCNSGIAEATEQKEKTDHLAELTAEAKEYLKEYYGKRIATINATMYKLQQLLTKADATDPKVFMDDVCKSIEKEFS